MEAAEIFSFARALGTVNRHPDPEQFAQAVIDAYVPAATAPAPIAAAEPAITLNPA